LCPRLKIVTGRDTEIQKRIKMKEGLRRNGERSRKESLSWKRGEAG
jgi:hypothetical protein